MLVLRLNRNLRFYSIKHATEKPINYAATLNLPKTQFPQRLNAEKREEVQRRLRNSVFAKSYEYQEANNKEPPFVLHDGPPYANGDLHMGHAVNKILKDITLRCNAARGQKVHFIPGWDCHGLPIELKATTAVKGSREEALSIRQKCRQYALEAIERQKQEFCDWGVLANWQNADKLYLTFNSNFITNQLNLFLNFYEKGLVYRDLKPVYWSPSSRTALAEAELEYDANFISPSVYVRFAFNKQPATVSSYSVVYALVWTTTPWTLPSNQAICYNSNLTYALVKLDNDTNALYIIAEALLQDFQESTKLICEVVQRIAGTDLKDCSYHHPIDKTQNALPFFEAQHVQDTKGTGLVHTAPAHGPEDFLISLTQKLQVKSLVNEDGIYTNEAPAFLQGKAVLEEGDSLVLKHIAQDVVFESKLSHAYPIDWRTKQPVIIRASEQWFLNTDQLKTRAAEEIAKIEIYPRVNAESSKKALLTQVLKRPYWCISRQRAWGVPIPVFYEKSTGKVVINGQILSHICNLVKSEGNIDFWWSKTPAELLPKELLISANIDASKLEKGMDIFDIWFDSGSTWLSALPTGCVADMYLEGYDQFTGWFQSSLLTSIAARDCAPYRSLFVHGFTVDAKGHKMSKSMGNVISPKDITKKYGVDVLRWWVASHGTQHMSIIVSDKLLKQAAESLSKIRATLRYLNGVIGEKEGTAANSTTTGKETFMNKYLLSNLVSFENEFQKSYNCFEYNRVVAVIQNFVVNQLSGIYLHTIKDRLYCGDEADLIGIQKTLTSAYEVLCKALWPIAPFLVEESWSYYDKNSAFHEQQVKSQSDWKDEAVEETIAAALNVKRLINQGANDVNTWKLAVTIYCKNETLLSNLQKLQPTELGTMVTDSELCENLQVGAATLVRCTANEIDEDIKVEVTNLDKPLCVRCRRLKVDLVDTVCERCQHILNTK